MPQTERDVVAGWLEVLLDDRLAAYPAADSLINLLRREGYDLKPSRGSQYTHIEGRVYDNFEIDAALMTLVKKCTTHGALLEGDPAYHLSDLELILYHEARGEESG